MRRQNPPQAYIEKAQRIERYLRPNLIASAYATLGIFYALLVSVMFAILIHESVLKAVPVITAIFLAIALIPTALAFLGYLQNPRDPLSLCITDAANAWRRPLDVVPEECTFRELLRNGEAVCINVSFYYPSESQTLELQERLYSYVQTALVNYCSEHVGVPTEQEIESAFDAPLSILAAECRIPVLYSEIHEIYPIQAAFNFSQNTIEAQRWVVSA